MHIRQEVILLRFPYRFLSKHFTSQGFIAYSDIQGASKDGAKIKKI